MRCHLRRGPTSKGAAQSQLRWIPMTADLVPLIKLGNPWLIFFICNLDFLK